MATRKLLFTGSTVLLAGDTNVDELLLAFAEQPVIFEVGIPLADYADHLPPAHTAWAWHQRRNS